MTKKYSALRNYKKFKSIYQQFVLFIKCGEYYYTYDSDAKILMYLESDYKEQSEYKIKKVEFSKYVKELHKRGLNVVLAGEKNAREYYTDKESQYLKIKKNSKRAYDATFSSVKSTE